MPHARRPFHAFLLGAAGVLCLWSAAADAKKLGISAGCDGCHNGGTPTQPTLTPSNPNPSPGSQVTLTVSIPATNGGAGGLFLRANAGSWNLITGQGTKLLGGNVVHSSPKAPSGGNVTFQVGWTAPSSPGGVDFEVWALASNGNNTTSGDGDGFAHDSIAFGCAGTTYYRDLDGDGFGAQQSGTTVNCAPPTGFSAHAGDCNDSDHTAFPGATEACDGRDNDCDGQVDEGLAVHTFHQDADGDGYGVATGATVDACVAPTNFASQVGDCADDDPTRHPGADEVCNLLDDDCDGSVDEGARVVCGTGWCRRYGPTCDPALCLPGAPEPETCNYLDDDCDGAIDDGADATCGAGNVCVEGQCVAGPPGESGGGNADGDGGEGEGVPSPPRPSSPRASSCAQASSGATAPMALISLLLLAASASRTRRRSGGSLSASGAAAAAGVIALVLTGCSSPYESAALGVRWEPPSGATLSREEAEPLPTARFSSGITLRRVPGDAPEGGAAAMLAEVSERAQLPLPEKILSHRTGTLPAGKVERMELTEGAAGSDARTLLYVVRGNGAFLVLTLTAPASRYGPMENQLERTLASLRFR